MKKNYIQKGLYGAGYACGFMYRMGEAVGKTVKNVMKAGKKSKEKKA